MDECIKEVYNLVLSYLFIMKSVFNKENIRAS